jgi:UDP-glucose 4-epimerase
MKLRGKQVVVTGGAGFVGSHLVERLVGNNDVVVVDNYSSGSKSWVPPEAETISGDLTDPETVRAAVTEAVDIVVHLAASKTVNTDTPRTQFSENVEMTYNILERMDAVGVDRLAYTSSSTVYGEAPRPTPETYGPLEPISPYGVSKLTDEGLISTYAHSHGIRSWVFRFANIVGPRLAGAVVPDFIDKLRDDPESLYILGDGRQQKSYMHIDDCLDAMTTVIESTTAPCNIYNLGTETTTSVTQIADIVSEEMELDPAYEYEGGRRGWSGDVPKMRLDISKLTDLGWEPSLESDDAVRQATRELLDER